MVHACLTKMSASSRCQQVSNLIQHPVSIPFCQWEVCPRLCIYQLDQIVPVHIHWQWCLQIRKHMKIILIRGYPEDASQIEVKEHATALAKKCGQGFSIAVAKTAAGDMRARIKYNQEGVAAAMLQMRIPTFQKKPLQIMTKGPAKRWRPGV